jgi:hypothetical protein
MLKLPSPVLLNVPALLNTPETPLLCATIETLVACAGLAVNTPVGVVVEDRAVGEADVARRERDRAVVLEGSRQVAVHVGVQVRRGPGGQRRRAAAIHLAAIPGERAGDR